MFVGLVSAATIDLCPSSNYNTPSFEFKGVFYCKEQLLVKSTNVMRIMITPTPMLEWLTYKIP